MMASEANVNASELACLPVEVLAERWPELSLKDQLAVYRVDSEKAERAYAVAKNKEKGACLVQDLFGVLAPSCCSPPSLCYTWLAPPPLLSIPSILCTSSFTAQ